MAKEEKRTIKINPNLKLSVYKKFISYCKKSERSQSYVIEEAINFLIIDQRKKKPIFPSQDVSIAVKKVFQKEFINQTKDETFFGRKKWTPAQTKKLRKKEHKGRRPLKLNVIK